MEHVLQSIKNIAKKMQNLTTGSFYLF